MVSTLTFTSARQKAIKRRFILLLVVHYFSQPRMLTSQTKTLKWPASGLSEGIEISLICIVFLPTYILFKWPRMMRYHHDNVIFCKQAYFFYTLRFFNWSLSNLLAKERKQRSPYSCFRHFWDRMMKSERKTYIIDKDMVQVPLGQLCIHDNLMCSLWQAHPISWPRCQTVPIKPVIIHVA